MWGWATTGGTPSNGGGSLAGLVQLRKQLAEIQTAHQLGPGDEIGRVMEAVPAGHLKPPAVRVGNPRVWDAEFQVIGDLLQYVGWLVIRGQNLDGRVGRMREDRLTW